MKARVTKVCGDVVEAELCAVAPEGYRLDRLTSLYKRLADLHEEVKLIDDSAGVDLGNGGLEPFASIHHARAMAAQALAEVVSGRAK